MMRTYGSMSRAGLFAVVALTTALAAHEARASWPPPPDATPDDVADPQTWPNDPAYGFSANTDGQWTHYGFMPDAAAGVMRRPSETATGMSIDLAWRISIGDPRVVIAVTDTGVLWDEPDLVEQFVINHHELAVHKPMHADQSACGGTGDLAGFDCNEDGVFTISDYAESLSVASSDHNGNGILDPGDLILAFSDGIDDDNNGYVDDISGWDFFKDDNDPFDDTRDGHGTREALISAASTNNGVGAAGVCPRCRILPLRVGDSVVADAQDFAQAVVYATDTGAKVVQSALETLNMTRFADSALTYAYDRDVLVVTATGHVGSRRADFPATTNHTLAAHALGYDGTDVTKSHSFLAARPCAQIGSQTFLSISSGTCGVGVAGALAGIAGLMASTALEQGTTPSLTAGEMQALLINAADDVDVAESRVPGSSYASSLPGFDERFGYGRLNANRVLEQLVAKHVPPQIDLISPRWFEALSADKVGAPIEIHAAIGAPRANAYDYIVDWADGVEPQEIAFDGHVLAKAENLDPTTKISPDEPLALLDVRHVLALLEGDSAPPAQVHLAVTVRIRATAHYGGDIGDVSTETRRTYYLNADPDIVPGFPLLLGDSLEASPKMADVNGDGRRDLIVLTSGGQVFALTLTKVGPVPIPGFPFQTSLVDGLAPTTPDVPNYGSAPAYASMGISVDAAREGFVSAPAIGDLDGDGMLEIVASSFAGTIYVIDKNGLSRPGFPKKLPRMPSCPTSMTMLPDAPCMNETNHVARGTLAAPVLVDLDGNGSLEIVQAAFDGRVYAFDATGADIQGFPIDTRFSDATQPVVHGRAVATPAVGDMNDDGQVDIAVPSGEQLGPTRNLGVTYLVDGRGMNAPKGPWLDGWPVTLVAPNITPLVGEGLTSSPAMGLFGPTRAIVTHGNGGTPFVLPANPGPQKLAGELPKFALPQRDGQTPSGLDAPDRFGALSRVSQPNSMFGMLSSSSLGDVDQDGVPDIVTAGGSASLANRLRGDDAGDRGKQMVAVWSGATGAMLPGSPYPLEDFSSLQDRAIADLDGDNYPEVIGGTSGPLLHAYNGCGQEPEGFPKFTGQWIAGTPAVGDLDGDGSLELAVGTRAGALYVWRTRGRTDGVIAWESFHHDNHNTGNLETPLDQGVLRKTHVALTEEMCRLATTSSAFGGVGGCGCTLVASKERTAPWALILGAIGGHVARRRVRRRASL